MCSEWRGIPHHLQALLAVVSKCARCALGVPRGGEGLVGARTGGGGRPRVPRVSAPIGAGRSLAAIAACKREIWGKMSFPGCRSFGPKGAQAHTEARMYSIYVGALKEHEQWRERRERPSGDGRAPRERARRRGDLSAISCGGE